MQLSKSKLFSVLLFCAYLICFLINSSIIVGWSIICAFGGLVLIWIGQGMGPVRIRKPWIPIWLEWAGWLILLEPVVDCIK